MINKLSSLNHQKMSFSRFSLANDAEVGGEAGAKTTLN